MIPSGVIGNKCTVHEETDVCVSRLWTNKIDKERLPGVQVSEKVYSLVEVLYIP